MCVNYPDQAIMWAQCHLTRQNLFFRDWIGRREGELQLQHGASPLQLPPIAHLPKAATAAQPPWNKKKEKRDKGSNIPTLNRPFKRRSYHQHLISLDTPLHHSTRLGI